MNIGTVKGTNIFVHTDSHVCSKLSLEKIKVNSWLFSTTFPKFNGQFYNARRIPMMGDGFQGTVVEHHSKQPIHNQEKRMGYEKKSNFRMQEEISPPPPVNLAQVRGSGGKPLEKLI